MYLTTLIFGANLTNIFGAFPRSAGGQKLGEGSEGSSWLGGNLRLPSRWFATWRNGIAKEPKASMSRMSMSKIGTAVLGTSTERNCIFIFFRLSHMSKTGFNIDHTEVFGWNRAAKFITLHANLPNFQGWELYYIYNWITSSYEMASRLVIIPYIYSSILEISASNGYHWITSDHLLAKAASTEPQLSGVGTSAAFHGRTAGNNQCEKTMGDIVIKCWSCIL